MTKYIAPQPRKSEQLKRLIRLHEAKRKQDFLKLVKFLEQKIREYKKLKGGECSFTSFWEGGCNDEISEWASNTFDPEKNGIAAAFSSDGPLAKAFDPEKNGVADSFRKFGEDTAAAFRDIGNKINDTFSKESLDKAFGAVNDYFGKIVSDPLEFMTLLITIAEMVPYVGPASDAALIAAEMAQGIEPDPKEVAGVVAGLAIAAGGPGAVGKKVEGATNAAVPANVLEAYNNKLGRDMAADVGKAVAGGTKKLLKEQKRPDLKRRKAEALLSIFNSIANFLTAGAFPTYRLDEQQLYDTAKVKRRAEIHDPVNNASVGSYNIFSKPPENVIDDPYQVFDRYIKDGKDVVADDVGTHVWRVPGVGDFPIGLKPNKITLANKSAGFPELKDVAKWLQLMFSLTPEQALDALWDYGIGIKVDSREANAAADGFSKFTADAEKQFGKVATPTSLGYNLPANFYSVDLTLAGARKFNNGFYGEEGYTRPDGSSYDDPPSPEVMKDYFKLVPLTKTDKVQKLVIENKGLLGQKNTMVEFDVVRPMTDAEVDKLAADLKKEGYALVDLVEAKRLGFEESRRQNYKIENMKEQTDYNLKMKQRLDESAKFKEAVALAEKQKQEQRTAYVDSIRNNQSEQDKIYNLFVEKGYVNDQELVSADTQAKIDAFKKQKQEAELKAKQDKINEFKLQLLNCLKAGNNCNEWVWALQRENANNVIDEAYREDAIRKQKEAGLDAQSLNDIKAQFTELRNQLPAQEQTYYRFNLHPETPESQYEYDLKPWKEMVIKATEEVKQRLEEIKQQKAEADAREAYYNSPQYAEDVKAYREASAKIVAEQAAQEEQRKNELKNQHFEALIKAILEANPSLNEQEIRSQWQSAKQRGDDGYARALRQFGIDATLEEQEIADARAQSAVSPFLDMGDSGLTDANALSGFGKPKKNKSSKQMNAVASYMPQTARAWTLLHAKRRAREIELRNKIQPVAYRPALYSTADAAGNFRKYGMVGGCAKNPSCGCNE